MPFLKVEIWGSPVSPKIAGKVSNIIQGLFEIRTWYNVQGHSTLSGNNDLILINKRVMLT